MQVDVHALQVVMLVIAEPLLGRRL